VNEDVYMPGAMASIGLSKKPKKKSPMGILPQPTSQMEMDNGGRLAQMASQQPFGTQPTEIQMPFEQKDRKRLRGNNYA